MAFALLTSNMDFMDFNHSIDSFLHISEVRLLHITSHISGNIIYVYAISHISNYSHLYIIDIIEL